MADLSVIVTAHREGSLLHRSLRSAEAAISEAGGLEVERRLVLDAADDATRRVAEPFTAWIVDEVSCGDPADARNVGVERSAGTMIALMDGDDIMSPTWLRQASAAFRLSGSAGHVVHHPEFGLVFGDEWLRARYRSSDEISHWELAEQNLWLLHVVAHRDLFLQIPFRRPPIPRAFHEDWHWYCEVLAAGGGVATVPETTMYYRRRARSLMSTRSGALLMPTSLFSSSALRADTSRPGRRPAPETPTVRVAETLRRTEHRARAVVARQPWLLQPARWTARQIRRLTFMRRSVDLPWLRTDVLRVHEYEPLLTPRRCLDEARWFDSLGPASLGTRVHRLLVQLPEDVTHLLVAPWLKRGGADLEVLNYVSAVLAMGGRPAVLTTDDTDSPWADRLPVGATFVDFAEAARGLVPDERERLLAQVLLQSAARRVHVINSRLGYDVLNRWGPAIAAYRHVYVSLFCADVDVDGTLVGYGVEDYPAVHDVVTCTFSDNRRFVEDLHETFGFPIDDFRVHYQPILTDVHDGRRPARDVLTVLWAGRFDRQKRPDVLRDVAAAAYRAGLPIKFVVYGYGLLDPVTDFVSERTGNIEVRGRFDDFRSLPHHQFDVFLNTSAWEGLPNILLEATSVGLPIVTSNAGGITEFVTDGESGLVIQDVDAVEAYVHALDRMRDDVLRQRLLKAAQEKLSRQHSWDSFLDAVSSAPWYSP